MKKRSRLLAVVLVMMMALSITATAITPRWNSTLNCLPKFSISGSTASCGLTVTGMTSKDSISGTVILYRVENGDEYTKLNSWSISGTGKASIAKTHSPVGAGTYEMAYDVTVSGSNGTDHILDSRTVVKR